MSPKRPPLAIALLVIALLAVGCSDNGAPSTDIGSDSIRDAPQQDATLADAFVDPGTPIAIDGLFEDWEGIGPRAVDPQGDANGAFDLEAVYVVSRGTTIYLRFAHGRAKNLNNGPAAELSLVIEIAVDGETSLKLDLRARKITRDGDSTLRWSEVDYRALPTIAASEHELAIDLAAIGASLGSHIEITFSDSDELEAPISFELEQPAQASTAGDAARSAQAAFRLLSLNTFVDGLADPVRKPALSRLIAAMNADIICLQEETLTTTEEITAALPTLKAEQSWQIHRSETRDTVIASRWPLTPLPNGLSYTAAGISLPSGDKLVVYNFHPSCCGYIGSQEDLLRILQTAQLVNAIAGLRDGTLGAEYAAFAAAPVIVVGDWNLVASGEPLRMLEASDGPALEHWMLRHLVGNDVYTYRADTSSFPPGMLDLIAHDATKLVPDKGFILDSAQLSEASLGEMSLEANDSAATDHLGLITDFRLK